jgi:hypothetical protein
MARMPENPENLSLIFEDIHELKFLTEGITALPGASLFSDLQQQASHLPHLSISCFAAFTGCYQPITSKALE